MWSRKLLRAEASGSDQGPCPAPQQQQPQVVQQPQATQQPQVVIQVQQPTAQQPQVMLPAPPLVQQPQIMVAAPQQVAPQIMLPQIVQPQILPQLPFQQQQCNCNLIGTIQIPDASVAGAPIAAPSIMAGAQCPNIVLSFSNNQAAGAPQVFGK
ncbi:hypothetical protein RB195_002757 [Necator americanus]|uniref:Uncharacterized protein n=1 Tax=Necator americanus TaxID=51031 RepID=A0ABR1DKJ5_NECAM